MVHQGKLLPTYCIDSSALIDLNRMYPYKITYFSGIWKKLDDLVKEERLIAPSEVYEEIQVGKDAIYYWCVDRRKIFSDVEDDVQECFKIVKQLYAPSEWDMRNTGLIPWADPWLLALSKARMATLVTSENGRKPNSIPVIAKMAEVKCLDILGFLEEVQSE